jgi:hypothetical protein
VAISISAAKVKDRYTVEDGGGSSGDFPDATNTGWEPTGVTLTTFGSTGTIHLSTAGATYDSKRFNGDVVIEEANITITRSEINGFIYCIAANDAENFLIEDSTINGGTDDRPAIGQENYTARRCNIRGNQHNAQAWGPCTIEDSWLHDGYIPHPGSGASDAWHCNAFITNGGTGIVLRHNTLHASATPNDVGGGPTADVSLFGDFGPVDDVLIEDNLFKGTAGGYGLQAGYNPVKAYPNSTNIRILNNTFERGTSGVCGVYGPYTAWNGSNTGNVWSGNKYDDDTPITA